MKCIFKVNRHLKSFRFSLKFMQCLSLALIPGLIFVNLSCAKKNTNDDLEVKITPKEAIVLEFDSYSCFQINTGIKTTDGGYVEPAIKGPVVVFNKMSMNWKKKTRKLYISSVKIQFKGMGIKGGQTTCDLTDDMEALFEYQGNPNSTYYAGGAFLGEDSPADVIVYSNPKCRIVCPIPLENPERPEIAATGIMTVKGTEVSDEGLDTEKYYRLRTNLTIYVRP